MGIFSFYPTKPLGGYGDGGIITCRTKTLGKKLRSLRFYGMKGVYYAEEKGYNSRLDEVHAEILRYKLKKLDNYILKRKELAKRYDKAFEDTNLITPIVQANNSHVFYVYVVKHKQRDNIIKYLNQKDIFLNISYPWPIHIMRGYKYLGYKKGDLPKTEKVSKQIFSLPMFPSLTFNRQDKVIKEIKNALSKFDK